MICNHCKDEIADMAASCSGCGTHTYLAVVEEKGDGKKYDQGKLRYGLLPFSALSEVVRVMEFGAKKYSEGGWKSVPNGSVRYWDAALRHLIARKQGEIRDPESGLLHLAHAACNVLFCLYLELKGKNNG